MTLKKSYKPGEKVNLSLEDSINNENYSNHNKETNQQNISFSRNFYLGSIAASLLFLYTLNEGFNKTSERANPEYDHPKKIGITKIIDKSQVFDELPKNMQKQLFNLEKEFYKTAWDAHDINNQQPENERKIENILQKRDLILNQYELESGKKIKAEWRPYLSPLNHDGVGATIQFKYE